MQYAQASANLPMGCKPKPLASLPITNTGMLHRPLGKVATWGPTHIKLWFDKCDVNDASLWELYDHARLLPQAQCMLTQNTAFNCVE